MCFNFFFFYFVKPNTENLHGLYFKDNTEGNNLLKNEMQMNRAYI